MNIHIHVYIYINLHTNMYQYIINTIAKYTCFLLKLCTAALVCYRTFLLKSEQFFSGYGCSVKAYITLLYPWDLPHLQDMLYLQNVSTLCPLIPRNIEGNGIHHPVVHLHRYSSLFSIGVSVKRPTSIPNGSMPTLNLTTRLLCLLDRFAYTTPIWSWSLYIS